MYFCWKKLICIELKNTDTCTDQPHPSAATHWVWWWSPLAGRWWWRGCGWCCCWVRPDWPWWSSSGCRRPPASLQDSGCSPAWPLGGWRPGCPRPRPAVAPWWGLRVGKKEEMWLPGGWSSCTCWVVTLSRRNWTFYVEHFSASHPRRASQQRKKTSTVSGCDKVLWYAAKGRNTNRIIRIIHIIRMIVQHWKTK